MMMVLLIVTMWGGIGFLSAGFLCAYWDGKFPNLYKSEPDEQFWSDYTDVMMFMLVGPIGFIVMVFGGWFRYGWRLPFSTYKETNND